MSRRTALFAGAIALGFLAIVLGRGGEPSARVRALEADPMATYVPPGGTLVDTDSQNEGTSLGKPVFARYTRMFQLSKSPARAFQDASGEAKAAGWIQVGNPDAHVFVADKRAPSGRIELAVTLFEDSRLLPAEVKPPALLVSLRHNGP
ncbi:MAG TPA: hypothetical protein VM049_03410 [Gaiellaceae bacterium]|nr:hypothetical protein [Gaiellaceae bacterium]